MKVIEAEVAGREVSILWEGDYQPCYLGIRLPAHNIIRFNEVFSNARQLSANLRAELGYMPACELLRANEIPFTSTLWDLNHDGPPGDWFSRPAE